MSHATAFVQHYMVQRYKCVFSLYFGVCVHFDLLLSNNGPFFRVVGWCAVRVFLLCVCVKTCGFQCRLADAMRLFEWCEHPLGGRKNHSRERLSSVSIIAAQSQQPEISFNKARSNSLQHKRLCFLIRSLIADHRKREGLACCSLEEELKWLECKACTTNDDCNLRVKRTLN